MYSFKYILDSLPKNKSSVSSLWVKATARPLSFPVTYLLVNMGCSANFVSILSGFVALAGCICLALPHLSLMWVGILLINFWLVLDCVDGNIARVTKKFSRMGEFFDGAYGYIICAFDFLAIGLAAYYYSSFLFGPKAVINIVIGALACSFNILPRLVYQKYTVMTMTLQTNGKEMTPENDAFYDPSKRKGLTYLRLVVDRQLGTSGLFMPFLILCGFLKCFDVMGLFYCLYLGCSCIAVFILFSLKASKIG